MSLHGCCINDLRDKEVINICDGRKLGFVDDIEIDIISGRLTAIIVPCESGFLNFGKGRDIVVPWEKIEKIGDDTILVRCDNIEYSVKEEIINERIKKRRAFF